MILDRIPALSATEAARIAITKFGRSGAVRQLTSERDQNFLIEGDGQSPIVLKVANGLEDRALLEAQQLVLGRLTERDVPVPRVVCTQDGESLFTIPGKNGAHNFVWAISHLPGVLLCERRHRPIELLEELGRTIGRMTAALSDFKHEALRREFHWDLATSVGPVKEMRDVVSDVALGKAIDRTLDTMGRYVTPRVDQLPKAPTHHDLNDYNILVSPDENRVTGIIDFGDMLVGWRIADLAIAAAYLMLDAPDPLAVLAALVRGATRETQFDDAELDVVYGLACMRLALSAAIASVQQLHHPENEYLGVSQAPIRRTLPRLTAIRYELATAIVREAAGHEPIERSGRVRAWLGAGAQRVAPLLDVDLRTEVSVVLDLSVASPLVGGDPDENTEPKLTSRIDAAMRDAGVRVAIGRYDEPRLL